MKQAHVSIKNHIIQLTNAIYMQKTQKVDLTFDKKLLLVYYLL